MKCRIPIWLVLVVVGCSHDVKARFPSRADEPTGTLEIVMAANGGDKAFRVWIDSEHPTTVPLGVPAEGSGFLKSLAGSLITIIVYSLLH